MVVYALFRILIGSGFILVYRSYAFWTNSRSSSAYRTQFYKSMKIQHQHQHMLASETIPIEIEGGWNPAFCPSFLEKYWQKRPLLVRKAFVKDFLQVSSNELLSLAQDEDVESRLISHSRRKWIKQYGHFDQDFIDALPASNWTILFQEVDRHLPAVASLWEQSFSFIPEWRRDDIMISYATPGGGIGAHADNYDVFLIQGKGRREWSIEKDSISFDAELKRQEPDFHTKLIRNFTPYRSWVLEEGDMLYLPPRLPHRGVSVSEECVTVSMGLRSPSYRSLVGALFEVITDHIAEDDFYQDQMFKRLDMGGEVDTNTLATIIKQVTNKVNDVLLNGDRMSEVLVKYLSSPVRRRDHHPRPFFLDPVYPIDNIILDSTLLYDRNPIIDDKNDDDEDLSWKPSDASHMMFSTPDYIMHQVAAGSIILQRFGGLKILYHDPDGIADSGASAAGKLSAGGKIYQLGFHMDAISADRRFFNHCMIDAVMMNRILSDIGIHNRIAMRLMRWFLLKGYYYPVDVKS